MTWWNCERGIVSGLMRAGHDTAIGLRVPPKCAAISLVLLERRAACPCPTRVIHVVHLRTAERIQTAEIVHRRDLLLDGVRDLVLREKLADAARFDPLHWSRYRRRYRRQSCCRGCPRRSSSSITLPACTSTCSTKPANTSINRRWNARCASGNAIPTGHRLGARRQASCRQESNRVPSDA